MWTKENRAAYDRSALRYSRDLIDGEWDMIRPLIPPARRGGNKRTVNVCAVMNGAMYILGIKGKWKFMWHRSPLPK